jgi:hypothetical protein
MPITVSKPGNPSPSVNLGRDIAGDEGDRSLAFGSDADPGIVLRTANTIFGDPVNFDSENVGHLSLKIQQPNLAFVSANGSTAIPTFRNLTTNDVPAVSAIVNLKGMGPVINVKDSAYGAVGDGVANDRLAFGAAIAAAIAQKVPLYIPAGVYLITMIDPAVNGGNVDQLVISDHLVMFGAGMDCTKLQFGPDFPQYPYDGFVLESNKNVQMIDFEIIGPPTVDTTRNLDGPNPSADTCGLRIKDCSTTANIFCERIKWSQKWHNGIILEQGVGMGTLLTRMIDCDMWCYEQCIAFFGPNGSDRTLHCRNVWFRNSGIPAEDNLGIVRGHTLYFHPNGNLYLEGCRFDVSQRYAIHMHSGETVTTPGVFNRIHNCYFGPGITAGILMSETSPVEWIGGEYRGGGNISVPIALTCIGVNFDPQNSSFVVSNGIGFTKAVGSFIGCNFGNYFRLEPDSGTWLIQDCTAIRGVPIAGGSMQVPIQPIGPCSVTVKGGRFYGGNPATQKATAAISASGGAMVYVRDVLFDGVYGYHPYDGPVQTYDTSTMDIEGCVFDVANGNPALSTDNTSNAGILTGRNNYFKSGLPSISTNVQYLAGRVGLSPTPVSSATSITLDCFNFDRFHVTGTNAINTIVPGSAAATLGFAGEVFLHADAAWSLGSSGNIRPQSTAVRVANEVVHLVYDPVAALWQEVY